MHDIDQALEDINTIKESIDRENMFEGIPTSSLTMITKEELDRKQDQRSQKLTPRNNQSGEI